jgi:hypothetical protein
MRDTVVYLGPTLARDEAERILEAEYLPPIRRGDLAKLADEVRFVGLIDGEFFQSLAVSPKEVLALVRRGVTVCGASSMGALRAAETCRFGTIGVGRIFAMYRDGVLDADDEVALVYEPETYRKHSEPLVNLRVGLELAANAGIVSEREREDLIERMKALYFPERSWAALEQLCPRLGGFFRRVPRPDPKRDDARELLQTLRKLRQPDAELAGRREPACIG